jgi:hypothetical protein
MARPSGIHQRTLDLDLLLPRTACGQCVGHFAECGLDGPFVLRDLHFLLHLGEIQIRDVGAAGEDRQADPRGEASVPGAAGKQTGKLGTRGAEVAGQTYTREERGARHANVGVGGA